MANHDQPSDVKKPDATAAKPDSNAEANNKCSRLATQALGIAGDPQNSTNTKAAENEPKTNGQPATTREQKMEPGSGALKSKDTDTIPTALSDFVQKSCYPLAEGDQRHNRRQAPLPESLDTPSPYDKSTDARNEAAHSSGGHNPVHECTDKQGHKTFTKVQEGRIDHHADDGTDAGTTFEITANGIDAHLGNGAHFRRNFESRSITYDPAQEGIHFKQEINGNCDLRTIDAHFVRKDGIVYKVVDDKGNLEQLPAGETTHGITLTGTITKFADDTVIDSKGESRLYTGDISHSDNSTDFADGTHVSARGDVMYSDGSTASAHFRSPGGANTYGPAEVQTMLRAASVAIASSNNPADLRASMGNILSLINSFPNDPEFQSLLHGRYDDLLARLNDLESVFKQNKPAAEANNGQQA